MMKKRLFLGVIIVFCAVMTSQIASADFTQYSGAWFPNDNDINYTDTYKYFYISTPALQYILPPTNVTYELFMYDWGNIGQNLKILGTADISKTVEITFANGNYYANSPYGTLDLGTTKAFGIYFQSINSQDKIFPFISVVQTKKIYDLATAATNPGSYNNYRNVQMVDAAPVPLPSTVLLMGTGLMGMGLIGFRRRLRG